MAERSSKTKQQESSNSRGVFPFFLRDNSDVGCGGRAGREARERQKVRSDSSWPTTKKCLRIPAWLVPSSSIPSRSSQPWIDPRLGDLYQERGFSCDSRKVGGLPGSWQDLFGGLFLPFLSWLSLTEAPGSALCCGLCGKPERLQSTTGSLRNTPFTWHHFLPVSTFYPQKARCLSPRSHTQGRPAADG